MKNDIVIVVPIYKTILSSCELISLRQLYGVLSNYTICFLAPYRMKNFFGKKNCKVRFVEDKRMSSKDEYSKLLLTTEFYEYFSKYDFMLIYQLDAFVFSDKLRYFCDMKYDYIGAPILRAEWPKNIKARVGNGGLSLRKISSCISITRNKKSIFEESGLQDIFEHSEDIFFAYCGNHPQLEFSIPDIHIALEFSIQSDVGHCYNKISYHHLPFGCHGWTLRRYFSIWHPYIESICGTSLEWLKRRIFKDDNLTYEIYRLNYVLQYLYLRIMRLDRTGLENKFGHVFPANESYIIWGWGSMGKRIYTILNLLNRNIVFIYDKNFKEKSYYNGISLEQPNIKIARQKVYKIIVATTLYEKTISNHLIAQGLKKNEDFILYSEVILHTIKNSKEY